MALTKENLKKLNELYNEMSSEQEENFLKLRGLFHVYDFDPASEAEDKDEEGNLDYNDVFKSENQALLDKYVQKIEKELKNNEYRVVLKLDTNVQDRCIYHSELFKVLDKCGDDRFLILVNPHEEEKNIQNYKDKVKKMFDACALYNVDSTIAQISLPKLLSAYQNKTVGYPNGTTIEKFKSNISKMIWYLNEVLQETDKYKIDFNDKEQFEEYKTYYKEAKQLFFDYFEQLWM